MRRALLVSLGALVGFSAMIYCLGKYGEKVCDTIEQRWRFI